MQNASPSGPTFGERLLKACWAIKDPIPGLFVLGTEITKSRVPDAEAVQVVKALVAMRPQDESDWLEPRRCRDIAKQVIDLGEFGPANASIHVEVKAKSAQGAELSTGVRPLSWSVAGFFVQNGRMDLLDAYLDALKARRPGGLLPGLDPSELLPVLSSFLEPRGLDQPMGLWLPAFDAPQSIPDQIMTDGQPGIKLYRRHDLFDQAIARMLPMNFRHALRHFKHADIEPWDKANYLARQAAHAHDVSGTDTATMIYAVKGPNVVDPGGDDQTRMNFSSSIMVGEALMAGAKISQSQWSGTSVNRRAFGRQDFEVRELVHTLLFGALGDDAVRAATIKRMHEEGHDVVVAAAEHAESNKFSRHRVLPLHQAASTGQLASVVALINAGADTRALVHGRNGPQTVHDMAAKSTKTRDEVHSIVKSAESRRSAHGAIDAIEREMATGPRP